MSSTPSFLSTQENRIPIYESNSNPTFYPTDEIRYPSPLPDGARRTEIYPPYSPDVEPIHMYNHQEGETLEEKTRRRLLDTYLLEDTAVPGSDGQYIGKFTTIPFISSFTNFFQIQLSQLHRPV